MTGEGSCFMTTLYYTLPTNSVNKERHPTRLPHPGVLPLHRGPCISWASGLLPILYSTVYRMSRPIAISIRANGNIQSCSEQHAQDRVEWSRVNNAPIRAVRLNRLFVTQSPDYLPPQRLTSNHAFRVAFVVSWPGR